MKKLLLTMTVLLASIAANAQKFALVDMEYILKNVPAYERANEQLNQVSRNGKVRSKHCSTRLRRSIRNTSLNRSSSQMLRRQRQKKPSWQRRRKPAT